MEPLRRRKKPITSPGKKVATLSQPVRTIRWLRAKHSVARRSPRHGPSRRVSRVWSQPRKKVSSMKAAASPPPRLSIARQKEGEWGPGPPHWTGQCMETMVRGISVSSRATITSRQAPGPMNHTSPQSFSLSPFRRHQT